jgi:RNA-directed DNA polymerase
MQKFFQRLFGRKQQANQATQKNDVQPTFQPAAPPGTSATVITPPPPAPTASPAPVAAGPVIAPPLPEAVPPTRPKPQAILSLSTLPEPGPLPPQPDDKTIKQRQYNDRMDFGEDLWGVAQKQLDATTNVAKLHRIGLPILYSEQDLADWLGIPLARLRWYTYDRPADTFWHYKRYVVPKRSGGERVILAPKRDLKALQRKVLDGIVAKVPTAPAAHGFIAGHSTLTNAQPHVGKKVILKLDLKDFFPSITFARVRGLFISLGYSFPVASALALCCTEYDREPYEYEGKQYYVSIGPRHLVQGAPTSPGLANLVAWRLDRRLDGLARKRGFVYTRYADDLTFSGNDDTQVAGLRTLTQRIIDDERFQSNPKKTRIARQSARQIVTGLVVNNAPAVPRRERRRLRAILHNAEKTGLDAQNREQRPNFRAYLNGMIAYIHMASARHAAQLRAGLDRLTS